VQREGSKALWIGKVGLLGQSDKISGRSSALGKECVRVKKEGCTRSHAVVIRAWTSRFARVGIWSSQNRRRILPKELPNLKFISKLTQ